MSRTHACAHTRKHTHTHTHTPQHKNTRTQPHLPPDELVRVADQPSQAWQVAVHLRMPLVGVQRAAG